MSFKGFKFRFFILKVLLICACGIKKEPKPPPLPEFEVKRIGSLVFLIPSVPDVEAEGFVKGDGFLVRKEPSRFCFRVGVKGGRETLRCVEGAKDKRPSAEVKLEEDHVILFLREEGIYRLYPYEGRLIPKPIMEVRGRVLNVRREYEKKVYALTQVIDNVESQPLLVEVPPIESEAPPPPKRLSFLVRGNRLYLYWSASDEATGFLVFRNGRLLTERPVVGNVFIDDVPAEVTVYEVVAVNRWGRKSKPVRVIYRP